MIDMNKVRLHVATDRTKRLIELLSGLEDIDRDRLSDDGKSLLDSIWRLLEMPTYDQLVNHDDIKASDLDDNGTLIEEEE